MTVKLTQVSASTEYLWSNDNWVGMNNHTSVVTGYFAEIAIFTFAVGPHTCRCMCVAYAYTYMI